MKDWLFGVIQRQPEVSEDGVVRSDTETESLRSMFHLVTWNKMLGGAGITPEYGKWKHVKAVYPLHNRVSTRALLIKWSRQLILRQDDLDDIRGLFGEKVGLNRISVYESCLSQRRSLSTLHSYKRILSHWHSRQWQALWHGCTYLDTHYCMRS